LENTLPTHVDYNNIVETQVQLNELLARINLRKANKEKIEKLKEVGERFVESEAEV
jgi:hypothetical protein